MQPGMAAHLAVFADGETTEQHVRSDWMNALMMLTIPMYSSHSLAVKYFDSSVSVNLSSFICSACNSTDDSTSCIVVYKNPDHRRGPLLLLVPRELCHLTKTTMFQTNCTAKVYEGRNQEASEHGWRGRQLFH